MFGKNKYKDYIEEPELLNSAGNIIDFQLIENYDFLDEINILNSIITTYNDGIVKGISYEVIKNMISKYLLDIHELYGKNPTPKSGEIFVYGLGYRDKEILSNFFNISMKDGIEISINNIPELQEKFVGDLSKSSENNIFLEKETHNCSGGNYKMTNSRNIEHFFNDFKKCLFETALSGFQVGYSSDKDEYRKLIYFKGDFNGYSSRLFDKDKDISDFLGILQKEGIIYGYDFNDEYIEHDSGITINKLFKVKIDNDHSIFLNTIGGLKQEDIGIYFSFTDSNVQILQFFEKLYNFRKNGIVSITKNKINNIIDLIDISPFNNRLNNKNITRANMVIREILERKKTFSLNAEKNELIENIRRNQDSGLGMLNKVINENNFDINKLKGNDNILDFIYQEEGSKFNTIELLNFNVVEIIKKDGSKKYININDFMPWSVENSIVKDYLGEFFYDDILYYHVKMINYGSKGPGEIYEIYIDKHNNVFFLNDIKHGSPNIDVIIKPGDNIKGFLLDNVDKLTKETIEDHGIRLEHIPDTIKTGDFKVTNKIIDNTFNLSLNDQKKIIDDYPERRSAHRQRDNYTEKLRLLDITTLTYLVLKHLDKIQDNLDGKILRLRSSTYVPNLEGIYNGREEYHDIGGEVYEVVIGENKLEGKIDIDTGSATDLSLGGDTSILAIFEKIYDTSESRSRKVGTTGGTGPR